MAAYESIANGIEETQEEFPPRLIERLTAHLHYSIIPMYIRTEQTQEVVASLWQAAQVLPEAKVDLIEYLFAQEKPFLSDNKLHDYQLLWLLIQTLPQALQNKVLENKIVEAFNEKMNLHNTKTDSLKNAAEHNKETLFIAFEKKLDLPDSSVNAPANTMPSSLARQNLWVHSKKQPSASQKNTPIIGNKK